MNKPRTIWPPKHLAYLLVLAALHYAMISVVSHVPGETLMATGIRVWDKLAHLVEYVPLGFLLATWAFAKFSGRTTGWLAAAAVGVVLCLGGLDELHQSFVPGRSVSALDIVADGLGGSVGALLARRMVRGR